MRQIVQPEYSFRSAMVCAALCLAVWAPRLVRAEVTLQVGSATVANPGDSAAICVSLAAGGSLVAGTQNDLVWDGGCATLPSESACQAAKANDKSLVGKIVGDFRYRGLILSLDNVDPIDDGDLYCCSFTADSAPGACCPIDITGAQAADPGGNALGVNGTAGELCVASSGLDATPTRTPKPTPTDCVQICDRSAGGGCQVAAPADAWSAAVWLGGAALLMLRRRR